MYRRVSTGGLVRVYPRVFRDPAVPESWLQSLTAALLWVGDEGAASHRAAAALWRFDGCPEGELEFSTPKGSRPQPGLILHKRTLPPCDVTRTKGIRVTSPTRTLLDLAGVLGDEGLEIALDSALRKGLTSLTYLQKRFADTKARGRGGSALMASLLAARSSVDQPLDSQLETRFLRLVRREGLPLPDAGVKVGRFRLDFAYPKLRLGIELDGYAFHSGKRAWTHDLRRRNELVALGWTVLHFTWDDVMRAPDAVIDELRKHLCPNLLP